ncbi:hypothetical protein BC937DRAFT_89211 [Endogone sp. FLAS-F59071]|nr:hypothetical protein BC937DRAFT_89211 [Endogone sp. FLAS-F59071]|eukprot:RUS18022.1 hypothetical protein BC937DRAFT_89211 [Endogone sp. FLAS-F59071]
MSFPISLPSLGTRIDYILVSANLAPWFRSTDILPDIQGSDHCPVVADFHDEIEIPDDYGVLSTVRLRDRMHIGEGHAPPSLCAKYMEGYSEKQQKLSSFFVKKEEGGREEDEDEEWTGGGEESSLENAGLVGMGNSMMGDEGGEDPEVKKVLKGEDPEVKKVLEKEDPEVKKVLEGEDPEVKKALEGEDPEVKKALEATMMARVGSVAISSSSASSKNPAQPPSTPKTVPSLKRTFSSSSISSTTTSKFAKFTTKSNPSSSNSQRTLTSFFKQPSVASGTSDALATQRPAPKAPSQQDDADVDVDIKGLAAAAAATQATKTQWNELFAPRVVPRCRIHGEPCKEFTVGKKGPNQGRRFWLCSRPLGPEVTTMSDGREIKTTEYRCDYFEWSRASGKNSNEANGMRKGPREAAEVGEREREKKR